MDRDPPSSIAAVSVSQPYRIQVVIMTSSEKSRHRIAFVAAAFLAFAGIAGLSCNPPSPAVPGIMDELKSLPLDKYIDSVPYSSHAPYAPDPSWETYSYDPSVCKCIYGDPFHISLKHKGTTNNVVFILSGGGACWPGNNSCSTTADFISGWADYSGNPLNGWNVIHVPYCDGSVHMGDHNADYDNDSVVDHHHWGLRLTTAAIALMREKYPNPDKVLITGCSAGGYGTFIAYLLNRRFFPNASIYLFNDSGPGLWNPNNGMEQLVKDAWRYEDYLPASCTGCDDQIMNLYDWILKRDDKVRIGLFSSYYDKTIGQSFLDMLPADYRSLLTATSDVIHAAHPARFNRFLIEGNTHCVAEAPGGYYYSVGGVSLASWIAQLVNDDTLWRDVLE